MIRARFSRTDCQVCALKPRCTRSARRLLTLRPREEHAALEAARARERQEAFAAQYRPRAGIEGTLSQGVRVMHLRRARYIGLAKVHFQHVLTAAALTLVRLAAWLAGNPFACTRQSAFVRLMARPSLYGAIHVKNRIPLLQPSPSRQLPAVWPRLDARRPEGSSPSGAGHRPATLYSADRLDPDP